jgi:hexosaminidase
MMFLADPIPSDTKLTPGQQKLILGGEVAMWSEQIHLETIDSRVWPRTAAIAERFWSPQSDRDVADMYRRLRLTSLELEDVGLTHLTGPEKLRRNLTGSADPGALDVLASVIEPVSFGERYDEQRTDGLTELDRLVDAVVADPPSRQEIASEVETVVLAHTPMAAPGTLDGLAATQQLRAKFAAWQTASAELAVWSARSPRLSDIGPRAQQLGELGAAGLQALDYLQTGTNPPDGWKTAQLALLAEAGKNSALVRFTFLPSLQKLVEAAGH